MQAPFDNIVQHLFHQPSLQSVTVDELERMAQQHPYFAAAHFLLLKKMQDTDHPHFNTQLYKTTLYFNNPLWLQYLLQPETVADFSVSEKPPFIADEPATINTQISEHENIAGPVTAESFHANGNEVLQGNNTHSENNEESFVQHEAAVQPQAGIMDVITEVFNTEIEPIHHPVIEEQASLAEETVNSPHNYEGAVIENIPGAALNESVPVPEENDSKIFTEEFGQSAEVMVEAYDEVQTQADESAAEIETSAQIMVEAYDDVQTQSEVSASEIETSAEIMVEAYDDVQTQTEQSAIEAETSAEIMVEAYNDIQLTPEDAIVQNYHETIANEYAVPAATEPEHIHQEISAPIDEVMVNQHQNIHTEETIAEKQEEEPVDAEMSLADATKEEKPLFKMIIETPASQNDFLFEPYHTIDYFASQGIKLSKLETDSKDKLGKQLKSFTEWLKSMKRLPQASIEKALSENEESKVMADAIHSIENRDVITEAMAEVFEKQGMTEKAAETYQKLSLLNPAKSAYFAAKIDLLKK